MPGGGVQAWHAGGGQPAVADSMLRSVETGDTAGVAHSGRGSPLHHAVPQADSSTD